MPISGQNVKSPDLTVGRVGTQPSIHFAERNRMISRITRSA
jgi:hypothetical protein